MLLFIGLLYVGCENPVEPNEDTELKIVYTTGRDGNNFELYKMNYDGGNQTRITRNSKNDHYPQFSPDGSNVYFISLSIVDSVGLYAIGLDGNNERHITRLQTVSGNSFDPFFSIHDSVITFSRDIEGYYQIYLINADGTGLKNLTNEPGRFQAPQFSPDGSKIVFSSGGSIHIMNRDGTGKVKLTDSVSYINRGPIQFSPDGSKIVFEAREIGGNSDIYTINIDGSNLTNLTKDEYKDISPSFSPDGLKIVFISGGSIFLGDVCTINSDGTGKACLTDDKKAWRGADAPKFSPDGSKIVFVSERDRDNAGQIYIMDADGSNQIRLTFEGAQSIEPQFQPLP